MSTLDIRYNQMRDACKAYKEQEEQLKNYAYGYTVSLDCVVPYRSDFFAMPLDSKFIGVKIFAKQITRYFQGFTKEVAECFDVAYTAEDIKKAEELITLIVFYLKTECRKSDYTFLGIKKILESFLGTLLNKEENIKEKSTFWIMMNDIPSHTKENHPQEIKDAFLHLYSDYDHDHLGKIADCVFYSVRFFLFDAKLDYMNDPLMHMATLDMMREIEQRLSTIYENRRPRRGWRK